MIEEIRIRTKITADSSPGSVPDLFATTKRIRRRRYSTKCSAAFLVEDFAPEERTNLVRSRGDKSVVIFARLLKMRFLIPACSFLCFLFQLQAGSMYAENRTESSTVFFNSARPIWPDKFEKEMNLFCGFRAIFKCPGKRKATLKITGSSIYRIFLNNKFIGHGPARAGHGYYRVDEWQLTDELTPGENLIAVEVAGYNVNSFYVLDQPSFLQAEVVSQGKVLASTAGKGSLFEAYIIKEKIKKVQRYSFQRTFVEYYKLNPGWSDWRKNPKTTFKKADCTIQSHKNLIPRRIDYPRFFCDRPITHVSQGRIKTGITPDNPWRDRALVNISPQFKGYKETELEAIPSLEMQKIKSVDKQELNNIYSTNKSIQMSKDSFHIFDFGLNLTGFIGLEVKCSKPARLYVSFDEILKNGDVDFKRLQCTNVVCYDLAPGQYSLEFFEPYTLRYLKLNAFDNELSVSSIYLREFVTPDADEARFAANDPNLNKTFEAARETYKQNSLDIFMDCPSRERAGWLCDSFFTSRVAFDFSGNTKIEKNFLENYMLPASFKHLPEGMLPMCYPADQYNGNFIPNWAMWFVVQLEEYLERSNDLDLVKGLEPKVMALFKYFEKFLNSDGLLEKLEKWVFVEWSAANGFVQDVNYPTNMLYTAALEAASRMYNRPDLAKQAKKMRLTIYKQSFDGEFFVDNAVRKNNQLKVTRNRTEVCQYFAFYFGYASPESHEKLWAVLRDRFGPLRNEKKVHPEIHKANAFIGNYIRIELLSRYCLVESIKKELSDFYSQMAEITGTLWENVGTYASCNHGFASHVAHSLYRDVLGIYKVNSTKKEISLRFNQNGLEWCRGTLLSPDGPVSLYRTDNENEISYKVKIPAGYKLKIENKSGKKLICR